MKVVLIFSLLLATVSTSLGASCPECLFPLWYSSVNLQDEELCSQVTLEEVFTCLDNCSLNAVDKPESYKIRQLTQVSDIFTAIRNRSCDVTASCGELLTCMRPITNYDLNGMTTHAPFTTVFNYNCSSNALDQTVACIENTQCVDGNRASTLQTLVTSGVDESCNNPRRCIAYGNIFEVKPGSDCTMYYQESAAYGPSTGNAVPTLQGTKFDPSICRTEWADLVTCPTDPDTEPIFSEFPPTTPTPNTSTEKVEVNELVVDLSLPCHECLYPVWELAVTKNGSHLCDEGVQSLVTSCLQACRDLVVNNAQLHTEVLVKISDLNKAFSMNNCGGYSGCTSAAYECTENLVRFYPMSAPHVTVNDMSCSLEDLAATLDCFDSACTADRAGMFSDFIGRGFSPVCEDNRRCMTFGNIYEYVPVSEFNTTVVPCAHYRQAPANGWHVSAISRVQPGLAFNTANCQPDWPVNVNCPSSITS